jgi:hypothetical protein
VLNGNQSLVVLSLMLPFQVVVFWSLCFLGFARAQVTVYGQIPVAFTQTYDPSAQPTILPAYDETRLRPPPLPNPMSPTAFTLNLPANGANVPGLSIVHRDGTFLGFSIEMSVINQLCRSIFLLVIHLLTKLSVGKNSSVFLSAFPIVLI